MREIIHTRLEDTRACPDGGEKGYEYIERPAVPDDVAKKCRASFYELPVGMANYPYHYHLAQEEIFYIIRGEGALKTPQGEKTVKAGDMLYFPPGESGAHKLTNTGKETLVYIDFDTVDALDVAVYPDSDKVGVWSPELNGVYRRGDRVDYYEGE